VTKHAIFCLGFEGIDLYKKLYPLGKDCHLFIHKQGLGTKDSQHIPWRKELTAAFSNSQLDLLYDWEWDNKWWNLPDELNEKFRKERGNGRLIFESQNDEYEEEV
jgi:hypothetical protein